MNPDISAKNVALIVFKNRRMKWKKDEAKQRPRPLPADDDDTILKDEDDLYNDVTEHRGSPGLTSISYSDDGDSCDDVSSSRNSDIVSMRNGGEGSGLILQDQNNQQNTYIRSKT